jgi:hypothetical protein
MSDVTLLRGETVVVIGASPKRGHLVVERRNHTVHVPYQYLEIKQQSTAAAPMVAPTMGGQLQHAGIGL